MSQISSSSAEGDSKWCKDGEPEGNCRELPHVGWGLSNAEQAGMKRDRVGTHCLLLPHQLLINLSCASTGEFSAKSPPTKGRCLCF